MDCYVVAIGGTGARMVRALVHLAGARVFDGMVTARGRRMINNINIMLVDSDMNNGDLTRTTDELNAYNRLTEIGVTKTKITLKQWSPLNVLAKKLDDQELMDYANLDKVKSVYEFLYTDAERTKTLNGGFYSHTSIGSYYMNYDILDNNNQYINKWKEYFDPIQPTDCIMLVGSIFGGTGASGVPTLARAFRNSDKTKECRLGGMFVGPYFRTYKQDNGANDLINWESFATKAKIALNYYDMQNIKDLFSRMYFIGEDPGNFMLTEHHIDAGDQKNKANVIELYSATSLLDFIKDSETSGNVKIAWRGSDDNPILCSRADLNTAGGEKVYKKLAQFFAFSVFYKNVLATAIFDSNSKGTKFKKYYNLEDSGVLYEYCEMYMNWIRELITETDSHGRINLDGEANKMTNWFAVYETELYNGIPQDKLSAIDRAKSIDRTKKGPYYNGRSPERPGFEHIVMINSGINSAEYMYIQLCDGNSGMKNIGQLVTDVIDLAWEGEMHNAK